MPLRRLTSFHLRIDENEGAGVRIRTACSTAHPIGDSDEYLDGAELQDHCVRVRRKMRSRSPFGLSLYDGSDDVRRLYVGCRCPACGLTGCYSDWKNEFIDYRKLLAKV